MQERLTRAREPRRVPRVQATWQGCRRCRLYAVRRSMVFGRGAIPADVVFIGIGPGKCEDLVGAAFVGPSGRLLSQAIDRAGGSRLRLWFDNLVACHPADRVRGENRDPEPDEVLACRPRLAATLAEARPRRVVVLGELARTETRSLCPDAVALYHPAYVVREGGVGTTLGRRYVREMEDVFDALKEGG